MTIIWDSGYLGGIKGIKMKQPQGHIIEFGFQKSGKPQPKVAPKSSPTPKSETTAKSTPAKTPDTDKAAEKRTGHSAVIEQPTHQQQNLEETKAQPQKAQQSHNTELANSQQQTTAAQKAASQKIDRPKAAQPVEPQTLQPQKTQSGTAQAKTAQLKTPQAESTQSNTAQSNKTQFNKSNPQATPSKIASSKTAPSKTVQPKAAQPKTAPSKTVQSKTASSKTAQSKAAPSNKSKPAAAAQPKSAQSQNSQQTITYDDKTNRIRAWGQLLRSFQSLIWIAVAFIVLIPLLGKFLIFQLPHPSDLQATSPARPLTVMVAPQPDWSQIDRATATAVQAARVSVEQFAAAELEEWESELVPRVDSFLDWYFDFFNQKRMEFSAPFSWASAVVVHWIDPQKPSTSEVVAAGLTQEFQKEFSKRVLVPRIAQMRLELIASNAVNLYLTELSKNMSEVQSKYRIPQGQWERYLDDISTTINDTEGNISNLSLKVLVGGSSYLLAKPLVLLYVGKIGSKVGAKFAGTAAAKLAAKTGGTVAAELGTSLLDPIVGAGILLWDFWDYHHTVASDRPILKANLLDYLGDVKQSLLSDPESGIMSAIDQVGNGILEAI